MNRRDWLAAVLAYGSGVGLATAASPTWRFGLTPVILDDRLRLLAQWKAYLDGSAGAAIEFAQRANYGQIVEGLLAGRIDFAWICGYPFVRHMREFRLVAVPVWRGRPVYQSYLIAPADSRATGLSDFRGKVFAFSDPLSNSGHLYVRYLLAQSRLDPADFFARTFFTYSHRHVVAAVAEGLADAGAVDGYVWETLADVQPSLVQRTRIVERSRDFGFPPVVAGPRVSESMGARFRNALLGMHDDAAGRRVLAELRLDRFEAGSPGLFDGIAEMSRAVG